MPKTPRFSLAVLESILVDVLIMVLVGAVSWFLIGYYMNYEYLATGYQDWMYHAYRIKAIGLYGISSWDFIWSNGLNHWKLYQYVPHLMTLAVRDVFNVTVTKAMLYITIGAYLFHNISIYFFLRLLKVRRLPALLAVGVSLTFIATWGIIKDYSIFFTLVFFPFIVYLWARDVITQRHSFSLPAIAGLAWLVHPVMGYSAAGLWMFSFTPRLNRQNVFEFFSRFAVYMVTFCVFLIPYITKGYNYSNPSLTSPQFLRMTLSTEYLGLSVIALVAIGLAWVVVLLRTSNVPRWSKILLFYLCVYIAFMLLGREGFLPNLLLQLQLTRGIPLVGVSLIFVIGASINTVFSSFKSRFVSTISVAALAILCTLGIQVSSDRTAILLHKIDDPVEKYFRTHAIPSGSIFIDDVSESSYFAQPGIRFVTSYNGHLEPHPLAQRFNLLLKNDLSYTGITKKQSNYVTDYSQALGVEYLFLPRLSPVIRSLTASDSGQPAFRVTQDLEEGSDFAVLQSTSPIAYAYQVPNTVAIATDQLSLPTIKASSWQEWDDNVELMAQQTRNGQLKPLPVRFSQPDRLSIDLSGAQTSSPSSILIAESYETNWHIANAPTLSIQPTSLRFMLIKIPAGFTQPQLVLQHSWPSWHWPLQIGAVVFTAIIYVVEHFIPTAWIGKRLAKVRARVGRRGGSAKKV